MDRAAEIAVLARRLRLLGERDQMRRASIGADRAEQALTSRSLDPLDTLLVAGASESEAACATSLAILWERPHPAWVRVILNEHSGLDPIYKTALYLAAPAELRPEMLENPIWQLDMDEQLAKEAAAVDLGRFAWDEGEAFQALSDEERADLLSFRERALRRYLFAAAA